MDIGGHIAGKAPLALCVGEPAGQKQVFLLFRPDTALLSGQMKGYHGTPSKVRGFLVFSANRHSGPDKSIRAELYAKIMADRKPEECAKR